MRTASWYLRLCALLALLSALGCDETQGRGQASGGKKGDGRQAAKKQGDHPAGAPMPKLLEAEGGDVGLDMVKGAAEDAPGRGDRYRASGGRCVYVPPNTNVGPKKKNPKGHVRLTFTAPKDGKYYIHPRVWWTDGCSNSMGLIISQNGKARRETVFTNSTYKAWQWFKFPSPDPASEHPRAFRLKAGECVLTFTNQEDNVKLDQVYVTDDPEDAPAGVMEPEEDE